MITNKQLLIASSLLAVVIIVGALFFLSGGCGPAVVSTPQQSSLEYCVVPPRSAPSPEAKPIGQLAESVRAKLLVCNDEQSDPRYVTREIPAGSWVFADSNSKGAR